MKTTIQEQDGNMVAILEGSLDTAAAPETEKAMNPLNDVEGKNIIIDCTALEYISSAGLRIFLGILQNTEEKGGHVYIKGVNDNVRSVFAITGFINIFEFC
ncbi:MAG: STAS domain-containing protein [Prevotella sp.]|nr:STAS domain-containing protein [Prevotella sp.]MBR6191085.1 STAS domain-containing protein [Prevotella sp.]